MKSAREIDTEYLIEWEVTTITKVRTVVQADKAIDAFLQGEPPDVEGEARKVFMWLGSRVDESGNPLGISCYDADMVDPSSQKAGLTFPLGQSFSGYPIS